jgi:hypothetical protein
MTLVKKEALWDKNHRCANCGVLTKCRLDFCDKEGHIVCSITLCSQCQEDKKVIVRWYYRFRKFPVDP